ncbi:hypothetical protein QGM61_06995 [Pseudohongiella sp. SYSU M77423]|uniref:hypothetical protein n=1 Tax=Pseudohongiella sp. SYSU M77423 TaxID=3042312 RepID=UPI0024818396|nr:hypothetical protein [Pseudohongiella sp. SYSU M77423]MDH7943561.1 hypothetical protein [Pseudohongiella sp. SYSU M77423]
MNWIDRYVAEIKRYLPAKNRDDVAEELQSLLEEEVLELEADRERPLTDAEWHDLLREFGHPMQVATRYGANGALVSAALYPLYRKVVTYLLAATALIYVVAIVWSIVADVTWGVMTEQRAVNLGFGFSEAWSFAVNWLVFITLGFHIADRYLVNAGTLQRWNPDSLPPAMAERETLLSSILVSILVAVWLVILHRLSPEFSAAVLSGEQDNRFITLIGWLKIQAVVVLAVYLVLLFKPHWTKGKRAMIMVADALTAFGIALCLSMPAEALLQAYPQLPEGLLRVSTIVLWIWVMGLLADLLVQGYKVVQRR